jgi:hypothetical protein
MRKQSVNGIRRLILSALLLGMAGHTAWASPTSQGRVPLLLDPTYDAALKYEASADKTITPQKVIRWMMGMRGQVLGAPSPTEFQPIVNAHDGQLRLIAAIAFKF